MHSGSMMKAYRLESVRVFGRRLASETLTVNSSVVSFSGCYRCYIISLGRPSCPVVSSRGVSVLGVLVVSVGYAMRVEIADY